MSEVDGACKKRIRGNAFKALLQVGLLPERVTVSEVTVHAYDT